MKIVLNPWTNSSWVETAQSRLTDSCNVRSHLGRWRRMIKTVVVLARSWADSGHSIRSLQESYPHLRISRVRLLCAKRCKRPVMKSINMDPIRIGISTYTNTTPVKESWVPPKVQNGLTIRKYLMKKWHEKWSMRRIRCKSKTMC